MVSSSSLFWAIAATGAALAEANVTTFDLGMFYRETAGVAGENVMGDTWASVQWSGLKAIKDWNAKDGSVLPFLGTAKDTNCGGGLELNSQYLLDTQSTGTGSVTAYRTMAQDLPDGIVGAARSACSTPIALLGGIDAVPQISYWSTSTDLDDQGDFPYFMRTIPDDGKIAIGAADFMKQNDMKTIAVIYVNDGYGSAYASAFTAAARKLADSSC